MKQEPYNEFAARMEAEYPAIFSGPYGGFEIDSGWYHIVEKLCFMIQLHVDWKNNQKEKYQHGSGCEQVVVEQIKEKFGGLRFYYRGGDDVVGGMVRMAEVWAENTCETCGDRGKLREGGWIRTLCDKHEQQYQEKLRERQSLT